MATAKKSTRRRTSTASDTTNENSAAHFGESAQQVWLAGLGALARAQAEGGRLFETLVQEGLSLEQKTRRLAGDRVDAMRDALEQTVGQARERASGTWDRLEKVFEDRVQRALRRLEIPDRDDLSDLQARVDALDAELRRLRGASAPRKRAGDAGATSTPRVRKPAMPRKPSMPGKRAVAKRAARTPRG